MDPLLSKCHYYWSHPAQWTQSFAFFFFVGGNHWLVVAFKRKKLTWVTFNLRFSFPLSSSETVAVNPTLLLIPVDSLVHFQVQGSVVPPNCVCITPQIGRVVGMAWFWHFHAQPLSLLSPPVVSLWVVTCRLAQCLLLCCPISWFRQCCFNDSLFCMRSSSRFFYFFFSACFLLSVFTAGPSVHGPACNPHSKKVEMLFNT